MDDEVSVREPPAPEELSEESRALVRALAEGAPETEVLGRIAESVRVLAGGLAVRIEHQDGLDEACVVATAGDPDSVEGEVERVTFGLGGRTERLGTLLLLRPRPAPRVSAEAVAQIGACVHLASVAVRQLRTNQQLTRATGEFQRSVEQKFRLISGIGEDLRNRLGAAAEFVQLLETEGDQNERELHYIARSRSSIDAALHLMSELVGLARAESGRIALEFIPVDITAVVRGMVHDYQRARPAGPAFRLQIEPMPTVETDLDSVRHILDNLLGNAARYTALEGTIRVATETRPGRRRADPTKWICVSVSDDGPGIQDADQIFEEVHRVERRSPRPGFRLAISRRVARLLGGDLTVESPPGVGATFTLWLPERPR